MVCENVTSQRATRRLGARRVSRQARRKRAWSTGGPGADVEEEAGRARRAGQGVGKSSDRPVTFSASRAKKRSKNMQTVKNQDHVLCAWARTSWPADLAHQVGDSNGPSCL